MRVMAWVAIIAACGPSSSNPGAGSMTPATVANDAAVMATPDAPPNPLLIDLAAFSTSCSSAADCTIVKDDPCNWCTCPNDAIATSELTKFEAAAAVIKNCPEEGRMCPKCRIDWVAVCELGRCIAIKPK
jgi:hypothetical protein